MYKTKNHTSESREAWVNVYILKRYLKVITVSASQTNQGRAFERVSDLPKYLILQ